MANKNSKTTTILIKLKTRELIDKLKLVPTESIDSVVSRALTKLQQSTSGG